MLATGTPEYVISAVALTRRLMTASAAVRRDRSGYMATARATTASTSAATPNAADRRSTTPRPGSDAQDVHHSGGGWTAAVRAFRPKERPTVGLWASSPLKRAVRLPVWAV